MVPTAAVSGLYFAHPQSHYFGIGKLNKEQITSNEQSNRAQKQIPINSAKKTFELLEHFMPQNRRIYNFGVKTLQPRLLGRNLISIK